MKSCTLLFLICFFAISSSYTELTAQFVHSRNNGPYQIESGFPFSTQYFTDEYNAHKQNWTISQDKNGLMYFGNGDGVLIYDGTTWELITLPNQSSVLALTLDKNGRMYVGAVGEIGYLEADSVGRLIYVSLLSFLKRRSEFLTSI